MSELSSSVIGSVSSCKDQVSLGLGCLYLLVLLLNKQHLHRAFLMDAEGSLGCGGGCCC